MAQMMALPALPAAFPAEPVRRRNSTYLALACANAVSQGKKNQKSDVARKCCPEVSF